MKHRFLASILDSWYLVEDSTETFASRHYRNSAHQRPGRQVCGGEGWDQLPWRQAGGLSGWAQNAVTRTTEQVTSSLITGSGPVSEPNPRAAGGSAASASAWTNFGKLDSDRLGVSGVGPAWMCSSQPSQAALVSPNLSDTVRDSESVLVVTESGGLDDSMVTHR